MDSGKGQEELLRAFARLRDPRDWRLMLVGDGPQRGRLEALTDERGCANGSASPAPRKDVDALLDRSSIFAFASVSEGYPNVLLEAMARDCAASASTAWPGRRTSSRTNAAACWFLSGTSTPMPASCNA